MENDSSWAVSIKEPETTFDVSLNPNSHSFHGRNLKAWAICPQCQGPYDDAHCPRCSGQADSMTRLLEAQGLLTAGPPTPRRGGRGSLGAVRMVPLVGLAASLVGVLLWFDC